MKKNVTFAQAAQMCTKEPCLSILFTAPCPPETTKKVKVRQIVLKGSVCYQIESFRENKAFHKNIEESELYSVVESLFSRYRQAECHTAAEKHCFSRNKKETFSCSTQPVREREWDLEHNRIKQTLLPQGVPLPFLAAQGITNQSGLLLKQKYHKFRQINKFLEYISDIVPIIKQYSTDSRTPFRIVDFGCGKAYLSFALYHYLHEQQKLPISVHGIDLKNDVMNRCTDLALQCGYTALSFETGNIAQYDLPADTGMMVCLHACNTATDYALANAIRRQVPVIFAVPCCQHEVHGQLKQQRQSLSAASNPCIPLLAHGIHAEQFASLLTDSIRGLLLEACGYTVQIMEFIETEHTPKNTLIRAVKKQTAADTASAEQSKQAAFAQYQNLARFFSIKPLLAELVSDILPTLFPPEESNSKTDTAGVSRP